MAYRHQPETIGVNLRLSTPTWHYRRQSKTIGTNLRLSASIWDYRHQPETIGVNLRLSAPTWDYRRQSETIGAHLRLSASPSWPPGPKPKVNWVQRPRPTEFSSQGHTTKERRQFWIRPLPAKGLYKQRASWRELSQFPELARATSLLQDPLLPRRRSHVIDHPGNKAKRQPWPNPLKNKNRDPGFNW